MPTETNEYGTPVHVILGFHELRQKLESMPGRTRNLEVLYELEVLVMALWQSDESKAAEVAEEGLADAVQRAVMAVQEKLRQQDAAKLQQGEGSNVVAITHLINYAPRAEPCYERGDAMIDAMDAAHEAFEWWRVECERIEKASAETRLAQAAGAR